jgi:transposase
MGKIIYDQEFKRTIVELLNSGKTTKALCEEFSISQASIHRWHKELNTSEADKQESIRIKALEKELRSVKLERDILKKAVSIFSKSDK